MDIDNDFFDNISELHPEILQRSNMHQVSFPVESSIKNKIDEIYASKLKFKIQLQRQLFALEEECDDLEQVSMFREKSQHDLLDSITKNEMRTKSNLLDKLEGLEWEEIENICGIEKQFEEICSSFKEALEDYREEKREKVEQEENAEVYRLRSKVDEMKDILRNMQTRHGLIINKRGNGFEFHYKANSSLALKKGDIAALTEIISSNDLENSKLILDTEEDFDEQIASLKDELKSIQTV